MSLDVAAWIAAGTSTSGMGILSLVLWWLFHEHLPSKDKQLADILKQHSEEREKDRLARQEQAETFQEAIAGTVRASSDMVAKIEQKWEQSANKLAAEFNSRDTMRRNDDKEALGAILAHCDKESQRREEMLKVELTEHALALKDVRLALEDLRDERRSERQHRTSRQPPSPPTSSPPK